MWTLKSSADRLVFFGKMKCVLTCVLRKKNTFPSDKCAEWVSRMMTQLLDTLVVWVLAAMIQPFLGVSWLLSDKLIFFYFCPLSEVVLSVFTVGYMTSFLGFLKSGRVGIVCIYFLKCYTWIRKIKEVKLYVILWNCFFIITGRTGLLLCLFNSRCLEFLRSRYDCIFLIFSWFLIIFLGKDWSCLVSRCSSNVFVFPASSPIAYYFGSINISLLKKLSLQYSKESCSHFLRSMPELALRWLKKLLCLFLEFTSRFVCIQHLVDSLLIRGST